MEVWDGYFKDGSLSGIDLIRGEDIPEGLYHLVCEVLVRHTDGDYLLMERDSSKPNYPGFFEATAGGSALKGEDKISCIKRELYEETGISADKFEEVGYNVFDYNKSIFYAYLCVTDCDKKSRTVQEGETVSYKWISEKEFVEFVNSDKMIDVQKKRYMNYFRKMGFIK